MIFKPHDYQRRAIDFALGRNKSGLFLPMGAGKTVTTLSIISMLLLVDVSKVLIIGPVRVIQTTWPDEIQKWEHTQGLTYSVIAGTQKQRLKALDQEADIYLIGKENVKWLCDSGKFDFDMVVIDELSTFKNHQSQRFKALKKQMKNVKRFIGLTGTPAPKGIPDLWAQVYLIDNGERLGRTITKFRESYLAPERWNGQIVYSWKTQPGAEERLYKDISDICMSLKDSDCVELPGVQYLDKIIKLDKKAMSQYRQYQKEMVLELDKVELTAANAGTLCGQLLQMASGEIYKKDEMGNTLTETLQIHNAKMEALDDLIESANGRPVLVFYWFRHEEKRIKEHLEKQGLKIGTLKDKDEQTAWNNGELDVLLLNPASAGHGLNLQRGGSIIVWYSMPNYNLELYQQANARLYRQGQKERVLIYHIMAKGTIDEDMRQALQDKEITQAKLIEALRRTS